MTGRAGPPGWPPGAATGVGSLPGSDPSEAVLVVAGELPDLPHLPELPARGPGAGLLGRGATLLTDLHVDLQPSGWRFVGRPGIDERRARDLLERDLDALQAVFADYVGPLKVQVAGPWTLAAGLELARGDKALSDAAATVDLTQALADGVVGHLEDLRRRLPGTALLVQLDEPSLPAVLDGAVRTASGFGALPAVGEPVVTDGLRLVLGALAQRGALPLVHCCGARPPVGVLRAAGARALSLDVAMLTAADDDGLGEAVEAGVGLLLGLVPTTEPATSGPPTAPAEASRAAGLLAPARRLWGRLGFEPSTLASSCVVTPACGLSAASPDWSRKALALCRAAGQAMVEESR